jgi:hypothetical protein
MTTLEELEKLLKAGTPGPWTHASDKLSAGNIKAPDNAALICAAINALPGLIESARRVERLEAALQEIADRHVPDQPAAYDVPREDYLAAQYSTMRAIARVALKETP